MNLIGRQGELARMRALIESGGGALVVAGRPGVGKTSLLDAAIGDDRRVLRTGGVQTEIALPFVGLRDLVEPILDQVGVLPSPLARAMQAALGRVTADGLDPSSVLHAFAALVAASSPLVIAVDDVQWLDSSSRDAVAFIARRARRLGVVVLIVHALHGEPLAGWPDLPTLLLEDLPRADALRLAERSDLAPAVAEALVAEVGGNPLALLEAPVALTAGQRAGREPLTGQVSVGERITSAYRLRVERLPAETQDALLLAAVSTDGDAGILASALGDSSLAVLDPAEDAELVQRTGPSVTFCHPEVRAAVRQGASPSRRRAAHRALAAVVPEESRAWHLAIAADAPDEEVADGLERLATAAVAQGAPGTALQALQRAITLTPDPVIRHRRVLDAGRLALFIGHPDTALALVADLPPASGDAARADTLALVGEAMAQSGRPQEGQALLAAEADRIASSDPIRASMLLTQAAVCTMGCGPVDVVAATAARARRLAPPDADLIPAMLEAAARAVGGDHAFAREELTTRWDQIRNLDVASPEHQIIALAGMCLHWLEELDAAVALMAPMVQTLRDRGAVTPLAFPLVVLVAVHARRGDLQRANELATEAARLGEEAIGAFLQSLALNARAYVAAVIGDDDVCWAAADRALALSTRLGIHAQGAVAEHAVGLLALGRGELDTAITHLERAGAACRAFGARDPGYLYHESDLIEAYVRRGQVDEARTLWDRLSVAAQRTGTAGPTAAAARCAALLEGDGALDTLLATAMAAYERVPLGFERARTQLVFGERFRRARRRSDARPLLEAAAQTFRAQGAGRWADRAETELAAAGGRVTHAADPAGIGREPLTAREREVCDLVILGTSTAAVAARLFLSRRTVEHHLRQIYRKLGVRSRGELTAHLLGDRARPPSTEA